MEELTKKELEIHQHVLKGKSNQQIADEMFVSINTVKSHVAHILRKERVRNRIELITKHLKSI